MIKQGEKMTESDFEEIMMDCKDIIVDKAILIEELAKYLMSR